MSTSSNAVELLFPPCGYVFDTHTDIQNKFIEKIEKYNTDVAIEWLKTVKKSELSYPQALKFVWSGIDGGLFELSDNCEFTNSYSVKCDTSFCEIGNLKVAKKYYWRVNGGEARYFYTKDNDIRFIKIDGLLNVRDIGGKNIKQGLIYRGSDLDLVYKISEKGKEIFCNQLGIKTEIDLRKGAAANRPCALGDRVRLKSLPYRPYREVFEEEHRQGICSIMNFLSDEENYPIYIHCLGGADRTGMIAFYLRALAGECDELIHLDYELTGLSTYAYGLAEGAGGDGFRNRNSDYYTEFLAMLNEYAPGGALSAMVRAFLLDCGVEAECIDKILSIISKKN